MKKVWYTAKYMLAVLLFIRAVSSWSILEENSKVMTAQLTSGNLDYEQAGKITEQEQEREEDAVSFCLWGNQEESEISCQETGNSARVSVLYALGNVSLLFPEISSLGLEGNQCYLDKDTAISLFGTTEVSGQLLWYQEHSYRVSGVLAQKEEGNSYGRMICRLRPESGASLDFVTLLTSSADGAEQFLIRNDLSGNILDYSCILALAKDFLLLLPLLMVIRISSLLKNEFAGKIVPVYLPVSAVLLLLFLFFAGHWLEIPPEMVPVKWSDFSFWSNFAKQERDKLFSLLTAPLAQHQAEQLLYLIRTVIYNLGAVCCFLL